MKPDNIQWKEIPLGKTGKFTIVDNDVYEWASKIKWYLTPKGYAFRSEYNKQTKKSKIIFLHREILNPPKDKQVDHKDRDKLNNRKENLRACNASQNGANQLKRKRANCQSSYLGIQKAGDKWQAQLKCGDNHIRIGRFTTQEEAARKYDELAIKYHGEFAILNFPNNYPSPKIE